MENKIVAIVQARLTSKRFPKKIIQKIGESTLIEQVIKRVKLSKKIDDVILAVPNNDKHKILKKYFNKNKIFFGSENDVLSRFYKAALKNKANKIIRICGDCPFIDPNIIDKIISIFNKNNYDYVSNTIKPTFPDGLDVEIFSFDALKRAWKKAKSKHDREHVTQYIIKNKKFKKYNFEYKKNLSNLRLTIDEKIDLKQIEIILSHFKNKKYFGIKEIYELYKKNKKVFLINSSINRNEGSKLNLGQKFWRRAQNVIPGGNMLLSKRPEMFAPNLWPAYYSKAKGCHVWDLENQKFLDMSLMSVGTNILGYSNKISLPVFGVISCQLFT